MERSLGDGAVAEEGHRHLLAAADLRRRGCTHRDGQSRGDDAVGAKDPDSGIRDVHRATPTMVRSFGASHELREHAERIEPFGQAVSMATMSGRDDIVRSQGPAGADRRGLLADRQVNETRNEPVPVEARDPVFEAADEEHALLHLEQI